VRKSKVAHTLALDAPALDVTSTLIEAVGGSSLAMKPIEDR
jgi:hypothetical protein